MIHFNVPPFVGTEFTYMQEAVNTDLRYLIFLESK